MGVYGQIGNSQGGIETCVISFFSPFLLSTHSPIRSTPGAALPQRHLEKDHHPRCVPVPCAIDSKVSLTRHRAYRSVAALQKSRNAVLHPFPTPW